ncbi:hypothetical protein LWI28_025602 [Acer negundo]|uniref:Gag-pol polyprotein n=1 Tax=Acer negundo TaxID=4023 RepID=A0AAD5IN28_ACENE|nr:hypothetical protein LWI28_025602 [Acer negundo]
MPMGSKLLSVIVGEAPLQQNMMTKFKVVDTPSAYNAILGEVSGDQQAVHNCYAVSTNTVALAKQCPHVASEVNPGTPEQCHYDMEEEEVPNIIIEEQEDEERGLTSGHPADQLEEIPIKAEDLTKVVKVGGGLDPEVKEDLIKLLKEYNDIFAWTHEEIPDIPLSLATYRLAIDETIKPMKQK